MMDTTELKRLAEGISKDRINEILCKFLYGEKLTVESAWPLVKDMLEMLPVLATIASAMPDLIAEIDRLKEEVALGGKIIAERDRLLDAIPACPVHGQCVPHAIEWVEKVVLAMKGLKADNGKLTMQRDTFERNLGEVLDIVDQLKAENESLKGQLEKATEFQPIGEACLTNRDELRASLGLMRGDNLHEHVEALRKDAERYRFIRDADRSDGILDVDDLGLYAMESLDEVVDEAMSKESGYEQ